MKFNLKKTRKIERTENVKKRRSSNLKTIEFQFEITKKVKKPRSSKQKPRKLFADLKPYFSLGSSK